MEFALIGLAILAAGVIVMLTGYAASMPLFVDCGRCDQPLVMGYYAIHEGKPLCKRCCKKAGIRPWYAKQLPDGRWLGDE